MSVLYFFSGTCYVSGDRVRNRRSIPILRGISIALLSIALVMVVISLIGYSRQRNNYPGGMTIGGVRVGGVDPQIASERVFRCIYRPSKYSMVNQLFMLTLQLWALSWIWKV